MRANTIIIIILASDIMLREWKVKRMPRGPCQVCQALPSLGVCIFQGQDSEVLPSSSFNEKISSYQRSNKDYLYYYNLRLQCYATSMMPTAYSVDGASSFYFRHLQAEPIPDNLLVSSCSPKSAVIQSTQVYVLKKVFIAI